MTKEDKDAAAYKAVLILLDSLGPAHRSAVVAKLVAMAPKPKAKKAK